MEIIIVTDGELEMTVRGTKYAVPKGFGIFVPPFEPHSFHSVKTNICHVLMFSGELVSYFFELLKNHEPIRHIFAVSPQAFSLVDEILPNESNTADYISAQALLATLCRDIVVGCELKKRQTNQNDNLTSAMEYIVAHFFDEIELSDVAKATGQHPSTLSKAFSTKTGVKFNVYLQYVRCSHAAMLLKSRNMSIAEIAYTSGFGSIRSFNRSFKSIYRITPSQYRNDGVV
jgi:AraC-like DNA-binding protein